jgi:translation initiation factor RLI1
MADKITRIAIVDDNRCKPKRCAQECKKVRVSRFSPLGEKQGNHL